MKVFEAELRSLTPLSQGRYHNTPKEQRELEPAYEKRTVLHKLHTAMGEIFIVPMAFKLMLENTAQYLSERVPGKGQKTYTAYVRRGIICPEPVMLGLKPEQVRIDDLFLPSQPGKAKSPRVWKSFPIIDQWAGVLKIFAVDDIFTAEVIERHLRVGGILTGIGVWRPENGGLQGKFEVTEFREVSV